MAVRRRRRMVGLVWCVGVRGAPAGRSRAQAQYQALALLRPNFNFAFWGPEDVGFARFGFRAPRSPQHALLALPSSQTRRAGTASA